ncbi:MAG: hypothetical protein KF745_07095 [Phycisphaeraceae bacterium]|nr:hypothetical protein [Phycisphaeraceae bacterium]
MTGAPQSPLGPTMDEARLEMAMAAESTRRSNQPRYLVFASVCALLLAGGYASLKWQSLSAARWRAEGVVGQASNVGGLVDEYHRLTSSASRELNAPDPEILSKLEQLGEQVGLPKRPALNITEREDRTRQHGEGNKKLYTIAISGAHAQPLIAWLTKATGENPVGLTGLETQKLELRPATGAESAGKWNADIILSRLERGS